jgi:hypothetical protein
MDYTLTVVYANGEVQSVGCATAVDVHNHLASVMRSQGGRDLPSQNVTFHVTFNFKGIG